MTNAEKKLRDEARARNLVGYRLLRGDENAPTMTLDVSLVRRLAHAAVLHFEFLKKQEGTLPPTEAELLKNARQIEAQAAAQELTGGQR